MPNQKYHTYRIGFNENDETEFDVVESTPDCEMAELMELFIFFLKENKDIDLKCVDYIEQVDYLE